MERRLLIGTAGALARNWRGSKDEEDHYLVVVFQRNLVWLCQTAGEGARGPSEVVEPLTFIRLTADCLLLTYWLSGQKMGTSQMTIPKTASVSMDPTLTKSRKR
jgi:hypothetical protein